MRRIRRKFIVLLSAIILLVTAFLLNAAFFRPIFIDIFFERVFAIPAAKDPELLSHLRILNKYGITFHQDDLTDASEEHIDWNYAWFSKEYKILKEYEPSQLSTSQQLSRDILEYYLSTELEGEKYRYHNYPVNQLFGVQNGFPSFMEAIHTVTDSESAEDYIERLSKVKIKFQQVLEGLKIRESKSIIPPTFVIDQVLKEMQSFVNTKATHNVLYHSYESKLNLVSSITQQEKQRLLRDAKDEITNNVYPAYQLLIDYFTILRANSNEKHGVWKLPDGDAYYAYILKRHTTTDLTPDTIHQIGLEETARIQQEIMSIFSEMKYDTNLNFYTLMTQFTTDPSHYYDDNKQARERILEDYTQIITEIQTSMPEYFNLQPKAPVKTARILPFKEKTSPVAYYQMPAMDGSRPGVFYVNLGDVRAIPKYGMRTLAYHEAVPGHHFQIGIQHELTGLPTFQTLLPFTAYVEGWALYAEHLASEIGYLPTNIDRLGMLQAELFRSVRLVVDTGIHYKRWTRELAVKYMVRNTGKDHNEVQVEVDRYIVMPGQATAYKIGMIKIMSLREKTKQALGERFDIREFHDAILKNGALPLVLLEEQVVRYIEAPK